MTFKRNGRHVCGVRVCALAALACVSEFELCLPTSARELHDNCDDVVFSTIARASMQANDQTFGPIFVTVVALPQDSLV